MRMLFQRNNLLRRWFLSHLLIVIVISVDPIFSFVGSYSSSSGSSCLQLLSGQVGSGNYTYYRLAYVGDISLTLYSVKGDADVYASQDSLQPTFDLNTHDLQSVTCGLDRVDIPAVFKRPVGIAIYGHPSHEISSYQLCVNLLSSRGSWADHDEAREGGANNKGYGDADDDDYNYYYYYNEDGQGQFQGGADQSHQRGSPRFPFYNKDDEEESILWTVLIGALKVLFEILT